MSDELKAFIKAFRDRLSSEAFDGSAVEAPALYRVIRALDDVEYQMLENAK